MAEAPRECCGRYEDMLERIREARGAQDANLLKDMETFVQREYDAHVDEAGEAAWNAE